MVRISDGRNAAATPASAMNPALKIISNLVRIGYPSVAV